METNRKPGFRIDRTIAFTLISAVVILNGSRGNAQGKHHGTTGGLNLEGLTGSRRTTPSSRITDFVVPITMKSGSRYLITVYSGPSDDSFPIAHSPEILITNGYVTTYNHVGHFLATAAKVSGETHAWICFGAKCHTTTITP